VPFLIHIPESERAYLDNLDKIGLSSTAKERIKQFVLQIIANVSDEFRLDPDNRPDPDKACFRIRHVIWDIWGDNRVHTIDFHIQDHAAVFGVLVIAYADVDAE
jgi:hypothetical protein